MIEPGGASDTWSTSPLRRALSTPLCPVPTVADWIGEGGGCGRSAPGLLGVAIWSGAAGLVLPEEDSRRLDAPGFPFFPDFVEPTSAFSAESDMSAKELLGLSCTLEPGIFERIEPRKDLEESFVSDLEKDGSDSSPGPPLSPSFPLEG